VQYDRTEAYVAAVAEVDVTPVDGQVRVKRVVVAHDCGLIINPDGLRNQIEGNVIQATSRTLKEEVKYDGSMLTSLDWISYPIIRFSEIPEVLIELINRSDQPAVGAGEATTSAIPAAIANAIFDATGVRLRTVPLHQIESRPRYLDSIRNNGRAKRQRTIDLGDREASCKEEIFLLFSF